MVALNLVLFYGTVFGMVYLVGVGTGWSSSYRFRLGMTAANLLPPVIVLGCIVVGLVSMEALRVSTATATTAILGVWTKALIRRGRLA